MAAAGQALNGNTIRLHNRIISVDFAASLTCLFMRRIADKWQTLSKVADKSAYSIYRN